MGGIPGPKGRWLVGDVTAYQRDRLGWLTASRDTYGDVVRLSPTAIAVHDPELAHQVLATTKSKFTVDNGLRAGRSERLARDAQVADWMRVRREVWHAISDRITDHHLVRFTARYAVELTALAGRDIDLVTTCRTMLGRAIVDFCAGAEADASLLDEVATASDDLFGAALEALVSHEGRVGWWPRPHAKRAVASNERLLGLLERLLRRRICAGVPDDPRDLVDGVAGGIGSPADLTRAVSVLRTIMFASHGVPGAALAWIILRLAQHPDVARTVAGSDSAYTSAVVKETLRLHPPQWLITRTTTEAVTIDRYEIGPGIEVLVCPWLMHRDPRWWKDPDRFDPTRFLADELPHARHAYLPFGAGPRICPGSLLATTQLGILTKLLAGTYNLRFPPIEQVRPTTNGLMLPDAVTGRLDIVPA